MKRETRPNKNREMCIYNISMRTVHCISSETGRLKSHSTRHTEINRPTSLLNNSLKFDAVIKTFYYTVAFFNLTAFSKWLLNFATKIT